MDYEKWLFEAISKTGTLLPNTVFVLKDLFDGVKWNTLSPGERREFGRQFKYKVTRGLIPNVEYIGKAQNNSSQYIKRGEQ